MFVDANGAYDRKQALAFAERFAELGVSWFEEPVIADDLEGLRLLRDRGPAGMDIAAGEYGYDLPYFRRMLEAGAVDVLQADASRCGGITGFLQAAAPVLGPVAAAVRPLRPVAARARLLRRAAAAPPGVFPRPRPHRADAVRRRSGPPSRARCVPDLSRPGHRAGVEGSRRATDTPCER